MATKTISVDLEAYEKLSRAKSSARESFSEVIKRAEWAPSSGTAGHLLAWAKSCDTAQRLPEEILDELDRLQESDPVADDRWAEA